MGDLVWYAAYGSNLSRARLLAYLRGGTVPGSGAREQGCTDPSPPRAESRALLPHPLIFAGHSWRWDGATARLDVGGAGRPSLARLYLLSADQFDDLTVQEGPQYQGVECGEGPSGYPIRAVNASGDEPAAPHHAYLSTVARGLRESWGLATAEIAGELSDRPGVIGNYSGEELAALLNAAR